MPQCKYKNTIELQEAIQYYFDNEPRPTPRHFRAIGLGISKYTLSRWKKEKPEYHNLIKTAEDLILAKMEQLFSYGGKDFYNIALTLKAYDREQYAIELNQNKQEKIKPIQVIAFNDHKDDKKQTSREIKLIGKPHE